MKLSAVLLYRYSIPLKSPVKLANTVLYKREGLILRVVEDKGRSGFGEIAPFPGFSKETLEQTEFLAKVILNSLLKILTIDDLTKIVRNLYPSVKFGFESAVVDLKANTKGVRLGQLLCDRPLECISVNGLLTGTKEEILKKAVEYSRIGYRAVKLKVGSDKIENDIELTKLVRAAIGNKVLLRLDANRCWQIDDALRFCKAVAGCHIDYLEEPLADRHKLKEALNDGALAMPIALDETTREISPNELGQYQVKAIVLKPTLLGFQTTIDFAQQAHRLGITPVIGSSFESGLGLSILAQIAAAVNTDDIPAGLDTYSWFADDIIKGSLPVKNGRINLNDLVNAETVLDSPLLKELI